MIGAVIVLLVACGEDGAGTVHPYDRAPVPAVPDRTEAIDPAMVTADGRLRAGLPDGDYWASAVAVGSGRPFILFDLSQALFGTTCLDQLSAGECADDYGVISEPHGTFEVLWDELQTATVVAESQQNFAVPGAELAALIGGNTPGTGAPADYQYMSFPFLVTVTGGKIVEAHQIWVP
ncbi:MAG: hypothetical protein HY826_14780 [Actinobacteria bacterium]|nr:hypothetical protein [Actinomycetota bacterium]